MLLILANAGEVATLLAGDGSAQAHGQQLRVAGDGVERRAQRVAPRRKEVVLRAARRLCVRKEARILDRRGGATAICSTAACSAAPYAQPESECPSDSAPITGPRELIITHKNERGESCWSIDACSGGRANCVMSVGSG